MTGKSRSVIEGGYHGLQAEAILFCCIHTRTHTLLQSIHLLDVCVCVCVNERGCVCVFVHFMWLCLYWLPPYPGSYLFSEVRRLFVCIYEWVCVCVVHAFEAHTVPRSLSYMPGSGLRLHGCVIIQRGKQPAPDLISCLGSHREVGKHYQLITVLPASPAFSLISLPRGDSASPRLLCECVLSVWVIPCRLLPTCL